MTTTMRQPGCLMVNDSIHVLHTTELVDCLQRHLFFHYLKKQSSCRKSLRNNHESKLRCQCLFCCFNDNVLIILRVFTTHPIKMSGRLMNIMILYDHFLYNPFFLIKVMPLSTGEDRRDKERQNKRRQDERSTTRPQQFRYKD